MFWQLYLSSVISRQKLSKKSLGAKTSFQVVLSSSLNPHKYSSLVRLHALPVCFSPLCPTSMHPIPLINCCNLGIHIKRTKKDKRKNSLKHALFSISIFFSVNGREVHYQRKSKINSCCTSISQLKKNNHELLHLTNIITCTEAYLVNSWGCG